MLREKKEYKTNKDLLHRLHSQYLLFIKNHHYQITFLSNLQDITE